MSFDPTLASLFLCHIQFIYDSDVWQQASTFGKDPAEGTLYLGDALRDQIDFSSKIWVVAVD